MNLQEQINALYRDAEKLDWRGMWKEADELYEEAKKLEQQLEAEKKKKEE